MCVKRVHFSVCNPVFDVLVFVFVICVCVCVYHCRRDNQDYLAFAGNGACACCDVCVVFVFVLWKDVLVFDPQSLNCQCATSRECHASV